MAIGSLIVFWGHYQDSGFLKPQPNFFILNNNLLTGFNNLPWSSQVFLAIFSIISFCFYYTLFKSSK
jgi:hypothetical protein